MKTFIKTIIAAVALSSGATATSHAQSLSDIFGGGKSNTAQTIGNVLKGIFSKSDLTLEDVAGAYESTGPAVEFKSDNFLQKAGGIAGATALENKLKPYYEQYGFIAMPLVINEDGTFEWRVKGIPISGNVVANKGEGTFTFNITVGKLMKLGRFTAYVEKTGKDLKVMFDATKLKELISTVGKVSGIKMAKTLATLLDSYEGACIGFKMKNTGDGAKSGKFAASDSTATQADPLGTLLERLRR